MRHVLTGLGISLLVVTHSSPGVAEGLWGKIKKGAETTGDAIGDGVTATGEAIGNGANAVGGAIEGGVEAVEGAVSSTGELVSNEETPEATRARLDKMASDILARLLAENTDAATLYEGSAGYAAFDSRKVTIFPVTTGYGRGVAVAKDDTLRSYMNMGTGGLGGSLGIGGFESQFVILFETTADLRAFVDSGYDATASRGAQAGADGGSEDLHFVEGRSVFVLSKDRWRVNASLEGTKYWRSPELND
ncbi:hypothetical protein [Shimia sp.]|uniref:hypothetical protein n=1 Tax=Shimia sp. TaxID=1954381 RepID=UPI003B8DDB46